jgi:hypothetical protein
MSAALGGGAFYRDAEGRCERCRQPAIESRITSTLPQEVQKGFLARGIVRAGIYARVWTHDQQTLPLQLAAMRDYVAKRGWKTALEIQHVRRAQACGPSGRSCSRLRGGESLIGLS